MQSRLADSAWDLTGSERFSAWKVPIWFEPARTFTFHHAPLPMSSDLDVRYSARLARLNLDEEEITKFQVQLAQVLEYVEKLNSVDVSQVEATAHTNPVFDVLRADEPREWFTAEQALSNAPRQANGLFVVPKVVES